MSQNKVTKDELIIEDLETKVNGFLIDDKNEISYEQDIYDRSILTKLDFKDCGISFNNPNISIDNPGENLVIRPLSTGDFDRGFIQLLGQLTSIGEVTKTDFLKRFHSMKRHSGTYYVTVIEDTSIKKIIGAATLVVEQKFIRNCNIRGLLEDVVVSDQYRGRQLGKLIVATINLLAKELGCYKLSLSCKDKMIGFYSGLGYSLEEGNGNYMQIRFPKTSNL